MGWIYKERMANIPWFNSTFFLGRVNHKKNGKQNERN